MSDKNNKTLKPVWRRVKFGDVVRQSKEKADPETSGLDRYVAGDHMDTDDLRLRRWGEVGSGYLGPAFHMRFKPGQVLYGSRRTYLRKVAVADFEGICANTTFVLEPKNTEELLSEFLPFLMQSDAFNDFSVKNSKGSVNPYINFSDLAQFEFFLPPKDEQRRVILAMKAFDECYESYFSLKAQGEVLLQSLLDKIWNSFPKKKIDSLIENGLIAPPQDGNHGEKHPKASDYVPEGVPFVMASDLKGGFVDFETCSRIPEELARTLRIGFAKSGDILLSHKGTVGEVARLGEISTDFVMLTPQVTYYRCIDKARLAPDWLYFAFQTPGFKRLLGQHGQQSTRAYIGIKAQRKLAIPVAEPHEQEQALSDLVRAEKAVRDAQLRARSITAVRKYFLAKALG